MERGKATLELTIVKRGSNILRQKAQKVTRFDNSLNKLIKDMRFSLLKNDGVGLTANQVNSPLSVFIWNDRKESKGEIINPVLEMDGDVDEFEDGWEGCLSIPGKRFLVPRFPKVLLKGQNLAGEEIEIPATDSLAIIFQHEYDHIRGKMICDFQEYYLAKQIILENSQKLMENNQKVWEDNQGVSDGS